MGCQGVSLWDARGVACRCHSLPGKKLLIVPVPPWPGPQMDATWAGPSLQEGGVSGVGGFMRLSVRWWGAGSIAGP